MKKIFIAFCLLLIGAGAALSANKYLTAFEIDLNGDGAKEQITMSNMTEEGNFTLSVNGIQLEAKASSGIESTRGFSIIDIDTSDLFKEIYVSIPGYNKSNEYLIYGWDGIQIQEIARFESRGGIQDLSGNGIILINGLKSFWSKREEYVLDQQIRRLKQIPQELYYVGVQVKAIESFPIYKTREGKDIIADLQQGSECIILLCDGSSSKPSEEWYLIKSSTGLIGWAQVEVLHDNQKIKLPKAGLKP